MRVFQLMVMTMRTAVMVVLAVVLLAVVAWAAVTTRYWYTSTYTRVDRWTGQPQAWRCEDIYGDLSESELRTIHADPVTYPWGILSVPAPVIGTVCRWK